MIRPPRQRAVLARDWSELVERAGARGERRTARLEGERHGHVGVDDRAERLDRVELQAREVVEAVEVNGARAPQPWRAAQRVERREHAPAGVDALDAREQRLVLLDLLCGA